MRILFMGTPDFAEESLKALYEAGEEIIGVFTNPDRPKGRGMKMIASPVKEYALQKQLPVYQPEKIKKNEEVIRQIENLKPDCICVVAYGKILPKEILAIPTYGCINVHASLLPKYRGAAPIQWAVINGEKETGITTMYMDVGMDTGDMIYSQKVTIGEEETTGELWNRLAKIGGELLVKTIKAIENDTAPRIKQGEDFSMAPMLSKEISHIQWQEKTAEQIKNLVRGLNPIMGAYTFYENKKIKLWKVKNIEKEEVKVEPGTVITASEKEGLRIQAKQGIIQVEEIQAENARKMTIQDFLRGNTITVGTQLK